MAQLLPPVCTDALKFQNPLTSLCPRSRCAAAGKNNVGWSSYGGKRKGVGRIRVASQESASSEDVADDYYAVLGLLPDATPEQIKKAYYNCMKSCHPDLSGDDPETTNFCMFINEVYEILSDPVQRMVYDEIHGYALTAINPFFDDSSTKDHVFVDEFSCIGCKNCANVCSEVFAIEEDFGRARAYNQAGMLDKVQQAVESCPVDCIHWTSAAQLSLLEDEMRRVERVNLIYKRNNAYQVALMLSGMGSGSSDVFRMASGRWEKRQAKVLAQAKVRMMKQKDSGQTPTYWDNLWGNTKDYESKANKEEEVKERAARAAAAARRWREYSRRGADKRPTYKLPEAVSNKE
ncbi:chaperone protein dnaJ C76, chloroplastic isoform X1 [Salvia hispanica]|uniref:chaperone protein dnaJ C76, chloroplastic isoform X1 n=1 Tax=Salvia hispanica TaxID=49212 RepID=UPI002008F2BB|nr:chaperone protein dnaJ C76, chloroplastic isoform X1 [Salvia hispanica]